MAFVALDKASFKQIPNTNCPIYYFVFCIALPVRIQFKFHCNKSHVRQTLSLINVFFFSFRFKSVDPIFLSSFYDTIRLFFAFNEHVNFILVFVLFFHSIKSVDIKKKRKQIVPCPQMRHKTIANGYELRIYLVMRFMR